jgi:hypothetical protein
MCCTDTRVGAKRVDHALPIFCDKTVAISSAYSAIIYLNELVTGVAGQNFLWHDLFSKTRSQNLAKVG